LSEWCEINLSSHSMGVVTPYREKAQAESEAAIKAIGTNGIPFFLKWITEDEPAWRNTLAAATDKLPGGLGGNDTLRTFILGKGVFRVSYGLIGFKLLGTNAASAVPVLSRMMANDSASGSRAIEAMGSIGAAALPPLLTALVDTNAPNRIEVARSVGAICLELNMEGRETNGKSAVPVLLRYTKDADSDIADNAAWALGLLHLEADKAVPALTNTLSDSRWDVRLCAARSLGEFGREARPAILILQSMTNDPNSRVRETLTNALEEITSSPP